MSTRRKDHESLWAGLPIRGRRTFGASALVICGVLATAAYGSAASSGADDPNPGGHAAAEHAYVGMWVTADGRIRQELSPDGRYDEARGERESAYTGRYEVRGDYIQYWDDTGFTADGTFVTENELHHGGMVFYRQLQ